MGDTKIQWADKTWNPVTGCAPISPGCDHCYARRMARRLAGRCGYPEGDGFAVTYHPERLDEPARWRKPAMVFVCSMGDLFHDDVPFTAISAILDAMRMARQHTFMVLTKRPERMVRVAKSLGWPRNAWSGVTAEDQQRADERIPWLLRVPAPVRFVSCEPLLGPIRLNSIGGPIPTTDALRGIRQWAHGGLSGGLPRLDWVIAGGETGPGARPMGGAYVRSLRDQCAAYKVPFFFKQWGAGNGWGQHHRVLDGRTHDEFPGVKP